jgi:hypothetical protein
VNISAEHHSLKYCSFIDTVWQLDHNWCGEFAFKLQELHYLYQFKLPEVGGCSL